MLKHLIPFVIMKILYFCYHVQRILVKIISFLRKKVVFDYFSDEVKGQFAYSFHASLKFSFCAV